MLLGFIGKAQVFHDRVLLGVQIPNSDFKETHKVGYGLDYSVRFLSDIGLSYGLSIGYGMFDRKDKTTSMGYLNVNGSLEYYFGKNFGVEFGENGLFCGFDMGYNGLWIDTKDKNSGAIGSFCLSPTIGYNYGPIFIATKYNIIKNYNWFSVNIGVVLLRSDF